MRIELHSFKFNSRVQSALVSSALLTLVLATSVLGQTPDKNKNKDNDKVRTSGTVQVGGRVVDVQGGHTAKFEEVRDVPEGIVIEKLRLDVDSANSPFFLSLKGYEVRERDQRFTIDAGRFGKYRSRFMWDQIPHSFGTGTSFFQTTAPGVYSVSPTLRAALQAVTRPDNQRTPVNDPLPTLVRRELLTAPTREVRLRRDQASFIQTFTPTDNIELFFQLSWLRNRGTRPMGAGTFVRRAVPGGGLADIGGQWEGIGQEFLEPIDQRTTDLRVGAQFRGKRWNAGFEYKLSLFRNRVESVIFENPFRVTDEQGCLPNPAPPPALTCGASNRFRMVRWQNDLTPNNDSHTINIWARFDVTGNTQLRGLFSLSQWTQNDAFLPWTLNTAIRPRDWDGASPITNPTDVNQLPARSLNGKMRNINQEYALVNRSNSFRFLAQYRSQYLNSLSPEIVFPGYAAFGDSTWRAATTDFYNLPIENLDWDFRRQNIEAGFEWDALHYLTWKLDYEWEIWNRKFRDVNRNNEHSIRNRLNFEWILSGGPKPAAAGAAKPVEPGSRTTLALKLDYRYANRRPVAYNTQPLTFEPNLAGSPPGGPTSAWIVTRTTVMSVGVPMEFNLLRRFDQAGRTRNDGSITLEFQKGARTNFSASYRYLGDEYDKDFYGLLFNRFSFIDTQFSHTFDNGAYLYATYSREMNRFAYRDLAHLLPNPPAPPGTIIQGTLSQYPLANTWERTSKNHLDSFEFGINIAPEEGKFAKWQFDLAYGLAFTEDRITTVNPFTVRPDSVLHAGANPYPDTVVRHQNLNIAVTRRINENFEIGGRYWYEPYKQDDFSFNVLAPYVHGNITSDAPKYLFQDARYGSYHSNVATFFLKYSF